MAAEGGYVAGKKIFIDYLINKARPFIFSTALSPLTLASAEAALNLLTKNAEYYLGRIRDNTNLMRDLLTAEGLRLIDGDTPIIAVLIGDAQLTMEIANKLKKEGILVSGIRPPTVAIGQSRLRITVTAVHEKAEIISAAKLIGEVCRYCAKKG